MKYQYLKYEVNGGIAVVTINRPEQRNALSIDVMKEMINAFNTISADDDIKVAVLTGAGKVFAGGADLKEMVVMNPVEYIEFGELFNQMNLAIRENSKPVIAAVNGHAIGGGNVLMMSADIIIASEKAKLGLPEINLGIFGGAALLPSIIGRYKASELVLLGESYTTEYAKELGIVNYVVAPEDVMSKAIEIASKIAEKSPIAVKMAKKVLIAGNLTDINSASLYQLSLMSVLYSSHDQKEGMNAFLEGRAPEYNGK